MSLLHVKDVSVELRDRKKGAHRSIFPRVSFELEKGETLAIIGDSGSGKTSLLNVVAGFIRPGNGKHQSGEPSIARVEFLPQETGTGKWSPFVSGVVSVDGKDVSHLPPEKRPVGMLMQSFSVFEDRSVVDNMTFKALIDGVPYSTRDGWARTVFDQLGFRRRAHDVLPEEASRLSGGEKQRVALGRLFIEQPTIWLLDEPYANLDAIRRDNISERVHARLKELVTRSIPVCALIVCHDLAETRHANKMLVLSADHCAPQWAMCERNGNSAGFILKCHGPDSNPPKALEKWLLRLQKERILE